MPARNSRRWDAAASGDSAGAGYIPASPRCFHPARYWISPRNIPMAAMPKPQCQALSGLRPSPARIPRNCRLWANQPQISGAMNAPVLMPM